MLIDDCLSCFWWFLLLLYVMTCFSLSLSFHSLCIGHESENMASQHWLAFTSVLGGDWQMEPNKWNVQGSNVTQFDFLVDFYLYQWLTPLFWNRSSNSKEKNVKSTSRKVLWLDTASKIWFLKHLFNGKWFGKCFTWGLTVWPLCPLHTTTGFTHNSPIQFPDVKRLVSKRPSRNARSTGLRPWTSLLLSLPKAGYWRSTWHLGETKFHPSISSIIDS